VLYPVEDQNILQIISKTYLQGYRLSAFYNSIYFNTFYETLKEGNRQLFDKIMSKTALGNTSTIETGLAVFDYFSSNDDGWLKAMDKEFDIVFRPDEFLSSLSEYVSSLVDLRSIYRQAGYPVDYMDWMLPKYHPLLILIEYSINTRDQAFLSLRCVNAINTTI
jgi:hypothetical protein